MRGSLQNVCLVLYNFGNNENSGIWGYLESQGLKPGLEEHFVPKARRRAELHSVCHVVKSDQQYLIVHECEANEFSRNNHWLWVDKCVLGSADTIDGLLIDSGTSKQSWQKFHPDVIDDFAEATRHAKGLWFRHNSDFEPTDDTLPMALQKGSTVDVEGDGLAVLNPQILQLPITDHRLWPELIRDFLKQCFCKHHLLDVVPDFSADGRLRGMMHSRIADSCNDSPVMLLLFSRKWTPCWVPFLLLDLLGGEFLLVNFLQGKSCQWLWKRDEWEDQPHMELLAAWCAEQLDIRPEYNKSGGDTEVLAKPYQRLSLPGGDILSGQAASSGALEKYLCGLEKSSDPVVRSMKPFLQVLKMLATTSADWEAEMLDVRYMMNRSDLFVANGIELVAHASFLETLCMRKLFPVSGLRVVFPDSPDILSVEEQNVWRDYRSRVRLDIAETALFAGRIWLEHLFGVRRKAHLTDSERSDAVSYTHLTLPTNREV